MQKVLKKEDSNFEKRESKYNQQNIKTSGRPFFNVTINSLKSQEFFRLDISVFSNNVFCSLKDNKTNKLFHFVSAGKYKIKTSKKTLRYSSNIIITQFFRDLKEKNIHITKPIVFILVAPTTLKKKILTNVLKYLKYLSKKRIIIYIKPKKVFNGCRAKKAVRKKHKRNAIYK